MVGIPAYTAEYALTGTREGATAYRALSANSRGGEVNPAWLLLDCYENCIHIARRIRLPSGTSIEKFCEKSCRRPWPIPDRWW